MEWSWPMAQVETVGGGDGGDELIVGVGEVICILAVRESCYPDFLVLGGYWNFISPRAPIFGGRLDGWDSLCVCLFIDDIILGG